MDTLKARENAHHILGMIDALRFGLISLDSHCCGDCLQEIEERYIALLKDLGLMIGE